MSRLGEEWNFDGLHWWFWERRVDDHTVQIQFPVTAELFGVSAPRIAQLVNRMVDEGRMSKTGVGGVYLIVDPAVYQPL